VSESDPAPVIGPFALVVVASAEQLSSAELEVLARRTYLMMLAQVIEDCVADWVDQDENLLLVALWAERSSALSLPPSSSFAPLLADAADVVLGNTTTFVDHRAVELACDYGCQAQRLERPGLCDTIHCFTVHRATAEPLNERLRVASLEQEELAKTIDEGKRGACAFNTNFGGFQSQGILFDAQSGEREHAQLQSFREVHALASAAMDEILGSSAGVEDAPNDDPWAPVGWNDAATKTAATSHELHPACTRAVALFPGLASRG
jgi:hypothetical protein